MEISSKSQLRSFDNLIGIRFQLYNSLFTSLPFHKIEKTGTLLSLFLLHCEEGYKQGKSPMEIVDSFLKQYTECKTEKDYIDTLFRFVQYAERQVVLFDALEDASFSKIHDMQGSGTIKHLLSEVTNEDKQEELKKKLKNFSVRLTLTAHPTQFYPGEVLGIIHDLSKELQKDNPARINTYLRQLGKTPFLKKKKPTPYDEAVSLIWYLENVFYTSAGRIANELTQYFSSTEDIHSLIRMGFWPGGDRDGNPFVNAGTTLRVAKELRTAVLRCYYKDVRNLSRRLTFKGVKDLVAELEKKIHNNIFAPEEELHISKETILNSLEEIKTTLHKKHNDLFVELVDELIGKVKLFGLFFASLDIRQDSSVHKPMINYLAESTDALPSNYKNLSDEEKIDALSNVDALVDPDLIEDELYNDTLHTVRTAKKIQELNGEEGCNRYIISHATEQLDLMEVYAFFLMSGWKKEEMNMDIIPLFESVEDLQQAASVMGKLYKNKTYREHLKRRDNVQTIMLGFSDGTKDGGYLMANWGIYQAKEQLTAISRKYDIDVVFFDGRGGPPARGGGKTHRFFASMGDNISSREIQLTIQGQTVSSNFGTVDSAQFNLEQLIHAGMSTDLFPNSKRILSKEEEQLFQHLADESYNAYQVIKNDPLYLQYLNYASPLKYYGKTNIGSRPSKRSKTELSLDSLRAVPFVGSWSQLKQVVPGFYGVGSALEKLDKEGKWKETKALYRNSLFLKALLDNCEMSMQKSFFPLTAYLSDHPTYGEFWKGLHTEFEKTKKYLAKLTDHELMGDYPIDKKSIEMRERAILPLTTIQQYALNQVREGNISDTEFFDIYEKLIVRCSFGIINAGRNSA
ncbi:MAG TPA: phosphoenolpyruvate carboxylase [Chitinophagaceae bacterium]|nr:phosphoenolpyruvate carboxylase [Chitinophagaceae bacterium]